MSAAARARADPRAARRAKLKVIAVSALAGWARLIVVFVGASATAHLASGRHPGSR